MMMMKNQSHVTLDIHTIHVTRTVLPTHLCGSLCLHPCQLMIVFHGDISRSKAKCIGCSHSAHTASLISDVSMWEVLYVHHDCEASVDLSTPLSSWNESRLSHTLRSPRVLLPPAKGERRLIWLCVSQYPEITICSVP